MYIKSAAYYDALYRALGKDYPGETSRLHALIQRHKLSSGMDLLDVACGTGKHLQELQQWYHVEGLDLDPLMLDIAGQRCPEVAFHLADMLNFQLGRKFDVITCLFSSIGYVRTVPCLTESLSNMVDHLRPGGVLFIEPWLSPEVFQPGTAHALFVDEPELKIARMNLSERQGDLSVLDFHYMVATAREITHFTERHELALFTDAEYRASFECAGLQALYDEEGLMARGLYIGLYPLA